MSHQHAIGGDFWAESWSLGTHPDNLGDKKGPHGPFFKVTLCDGELLNELGDFVLVEPLSN